MAELKQWVNIGKNQTVMHTVPGEASLTKPRCGPRVALRAKTKGPGKKHRRKVYWAVQPGDDNVVPRSAAGTPPGWTWVPHQGGFGAPGFYEKLQPTGKKGWSFTTFDLSQCGGDTFEVKAYTKDKAGNVKQELKSDKYIVWRQLFYQVTKMGPSVGKVTLPAIPDIPWGDVKAEYDDSRKPHNLRWSEVPAANPVLTRVRALWNQPLKKATGVEGYDRSREPLVVKVSICDLLSQRGQEDHTFTVVKPQRTYTHTHSKVLFDLNSLDDKDDWYLSSSAQRPGGGAVPVTRGDFTKTGPATVTCQLSAIPKTGVLDFCRRANVELKMYVFTGSTAGFSWYNGVWVSQHRPAGNQIVTRPPAQKVALMVHELGHAIGMVPTGHPFHYPTSHDHVGPHCWKDATDPSTFPPADPFPTAGTCTMFGSLSSNTEKFCDDCAPFVRSVKPSVDGNFKASGMLPTTW